MHIFFLPKYWNLYGDHFKSDIPIGDLTEYINVYYSQLRFFCLVFELILSILLNVLKLMAYLQIILNGKLLHNTQNIIVSVNSCLIIVFSFLGNPDSHGAPRRSNTAKCWLRPIMFLKYVTGPFSAPKSNTVYFLF